MHKDLYYHLIEVARNKGTTTYGEIGPIVGILDFSNPGSGIQIGEILGEISKYEHSCGRPMLSALVTYKDEPKPGPGFFTLARELGLLMRTDKDAELEFFAQELRKVHDHWSKN